METRELGKNGPHVPILCFGGAPIGGEIGAVAEDQAIATVRAALDIGMTFIDTSDNYRTSESRIGRALRGRRREELFLATKLSDDHSPARISWAVENSLKALGTDYIDLYQLHEPQALWPIEQTMEQLLRLRDAGKIRHIGVSNFSAGETLEALKHGPILSSQPLYNMLFRDAEESVLPCCIENGIGVLAYSVLGQGLLTGHYRPGHRFPPEDERNTYSVFKGESFKRTFEVTERLKEWAPIMAATWCNWPSSGRWPTQRLHPAWWAQRHRSSYTITPKQRPGS